jgi:hypothetical protein
MTLCKTIKESTYQNFYLNSDNVIYGIVSPKEIWKISDPQELLEYMENQLNGELECGNYCYNKEHMTYKQQKQDKMIKRLINTIKKQSVG